MEATTKIDEARNDQPVGAVMIIGGGTGLASLVPLAEHLAGVSTKITFLLGAKTRAELLFLDRIGHAVSKATGSIIATTEDGSCGSKGVITTPAENLVAQEEFDRLYTCGPEQMMHKVFLLAERHNLPLEASLERLMRCGMGLCGSCTIGQFTVCRDGPVFSREQLRRVIGEFGRFRRDMSGIKTPIQASTT